MNNKSGYLFAILTALCWAVLAVALKYTVQHVSSGTIVWFRMFVALIGLATIFLIVHPKQFKQTIKIPPLAYVAGLFLSANYFGYMKGVELTTASNTQIVIQTGPLLLVLIGIFYFKEKIKWYQILGLCIALTGYSLFYWDQLLVSFNNLDQYLEGNSWIFMAAVTWAIYASLQKIVAVNWTPQQINLAIYVTATIVLIPLADFSEFQNLSPSLWVIIVFLGLNTLVAYGSLGEALKRIPSYQLSPIITLNPLLTLLIVDLLTLFQVSWYTPEPLNWRGYLGAFFVILGVILTVTKFKKAK